MPDYVSTPDGTVAGYQPPEEGPFKCLNCEYFIGSNSTCIRPELIEELGHDHVDSEGCCNFYEKSDGDEKNDEKEGEKMPLSNYFKGGGNKVMKNMKKQYGTKKGKSVFYATANKLDVAPSKMKNKKSA